MKALIIGDVHLSDVPPSIRTKDYTEHLLEKLAHAVRLGKENDVDVIVQAGDMFHIKAPSRTSHRLVQQAAEVLTGEGLPIRIVPGNHDLQNDRLESLPKQPLGALCKMREIELLIGQDADFTDLYGVPYQWNWSMQLQQRIKEWQYAGEPPLMVTHAPIFPANENPPYEHISSEEWAGLMLGMGLAEKKYVYLGHIHDCYGEWQSKGVVFCNQGALSRGSLHEATLKRKPAVTLWETGKGFTRLEIPHRPVEEVFLLTEHSEGTEKKARLDDFLDSLGESNLVGLSVEEVLSKVQSMSLDPMTKGVIEECVEAAATNRQH